MGLLKNKLLKEDQNYINAFQVIDLISAYADDDSKTVVKYLLRENIYKSLLTYCRDDIGNYEIIDSYPFCTYGVLTTIFELKDYDQNFLITSFNYPELLEYEDLLWRKSDLLNCSSIVKIGIDTKIIEHFLKYNYCKNNKDDFKPFSDFENTNKVISNISKAPPPIIPIKGGFIQNNKAKNSIEMSLDTAHKEIGQLQKEISNLNVKLLKKEERIKELEALQINKNAIINTDISLKNSDLVFISVLMKNLQNAITVKGNKSQAKILQKIETESNGVIGLSKSRTEKVMQEANKLYKQLINK